MKKPPAKEPDIMAANASATKRTRIVFDDKSLVPEQDAHAHDPSPAPRVEDEDHDHEDSDSDAPEAVSTAHLASQIKASAQNAQKAAQEQTAAQKKKRRERDAALKKRATERKTGEPEPAKIARTRYQPTTTPVLLPAELLTDSDPDSDSDPAAGHGEGHTTTRSKAAQAAGPPPKRRRVDTVERLLAKERKAPADKKVGSTVYRVMKPRADATQAPPSSKRSIAIRDSLRQRQRTAVAVHRRFSGSKK